MSCGAMGLGTVTDVTAAIKALHNGPMAISVSIEYIEEMLNTKCTICTLGMPEIEERRLVQNSLGTKIFDKICIAH